MKKFKLLKCLLGMALLMSIGLRCECKNRSKKSINQLSVTLTLSQELIYLEDGATSFILTIRSQDELAQEAQYKLVDWLVKDNLGKVVHAGGDLIESGYELSYGDTQLYYQPNPGSEGKHMLEVTVSDEEGTLKKKQQLAMLVKDHRPVDFQVGLKPERSPVLVHESAKLLIDITSRQEGAHQLTYQIKEISSDKKGTFSATASGMPLGPNHGLTYGKNTLYYHNLAKEAGVHDLKLVVVNSKGDTQAVQTSLNILDTEFEVKIKLEKPSIFFYEQAKLFLEITSQQRGVDQLSYYVQEISTSQEKGKFFTTLEGSKMSTEQVLCYGKNVLYYHPHEQLGTHDIKLVVKNSNGNTKTILASLQVLDTDFQVKLKPEKPSICSHEQAKLRIQITSKQEGADQLTYQVQEISTLEKGKFFATPEGGKIHADHVLSYDKSVLYYNPSKQIGTHELKLVVTSSHGNTKTALASLEVLDTDFQVKIKPEKTTTFFHEPVKMRIEISSHQAGSAQLTYQIQEINASKKGYFSLTPQGEPINEKQILDYGENVWYYHPNQELGTHELKLVVTSSTGNTRTVLTSLEVLDTDFQVKIKPEESSTFFHEPIKMMIEIRSNQAGSAQLTYQIQEINASKKEHFSLTPQGEPINEKQALDYGENVWYYNPSKQLGMHDIKLLVTNTHGNTKTALVSIQVLDIDFQVKLKPDKTKLFCHETVPMQVELTAAQEAGQQLVTYQVQAIHTSIQGGELLTSAGMPVLAGQALAYGQHTWSYIPHQPGTHRIQLQVVNNNGTIQEATALLEVRDTDFQLEIKPEKSNLFSHEPVKLLIHITGSQEGLDKLNYQLQEINTPEAGQLSATLQGAPLIPNQALSYGKNTGYYKPNQPGVHTIQLVVTNQGTTKKAIALLTAHQAIFATEVNIDKPAKAPDTTWEVGLHLRSNSDLKEEKWQLSSRQIEELGVSKLQDAANYPVAEKGALLQAGLNKFKLVFNEAVELKKVPYLKLTILQPDGKEKQLVLDLGKCVFPQLERSFGLLEEQVQLAEKKLVTGEPLDQGKLDRVIVQLKKLRSNLNVIALSTSIDQYALENTCLKLDKILAHSNKKVLINQAIQAKFGRNINELDHQGRIPLIEAIDKKDLPGVDLILTHPDVNLKIRATLSRNPAPYPIVAYTVIKGGNDTKILEKLIQAGADIHERVAISRQPWSVPSEWNDDIDSEEKMRRMSS